MHGGGCMVYGVGCTEVHSAWTGVRCELCPGVGCMEWSAWSGVHEVGTRVHGVSGGVH